MPKYVYKCKCENEIVVDCKMSEYKSLVTCDICGELAERKCDDIVCALTIDKTGSFYRKIN